MNAHTRALKAEYALRLRLEQKIEELISLLDLLDSDPDLEEGADAEPWLGWITTHRGIAEFGDIFDLEAEGEHDEDGHNQEDDTSDREPSLGWTHQEAHHRHGRYATAWGANQDLELTSSPYEPEFSPMQEIDL